MWYLASLQIGSALSFIYRFVPSNVKKRMQRNLICVANVKLRSVYRNRQFCFYTSCKHVRTTVIKTSLQVFMLPSFIIIKLTMSCRIWWNLILAFWHITANQTPCSRNNKNKTWQASYERKCHYHSRALATGIGLWDHL